MRYNTLYNIRLRGWCLIVRGTLAVMTTMAATVASPREAAASILAGDTTSNTASDTAGGINGGINGGMIGGIATHVIATAENSPDSLRYRKYTPSMCVPHQQQWLSTRPFRPDTIRWTPFLAKWHPDAIAEARRCVGRFALATVDRHQLLGFGEALLAAGDMQGADAAFERLASQLATESASVRAWEINRIVDVNLRTRPVRLAAVEPYLAKLQAMGDSALGMLAMTHFEIANVAQEADSVRLMQEHVQVALESLKKLSPDSAKRYAWPMIQVYTLQADVEARRSEFDKARTTMQEVSNIIRRIRSALHDRVSTRVAAYKLLGEPAATLEVHRWTNVAGTRAVPVAGKTNLVVFARVDCGDECYEGYAVIRRLVQLYPDLEITLVVNTGGYYRTMLVSVEKEAELVTEHFNNVLGLSLPIAFWESKFDRRDSDGRLLIRRVPNNEAYHLRELSRAMYNGPIAFLVDSKGVIRLNVALSWKTAAMVENITGEILQ